jgi:hypothetical protein
MVKALHSKMLMCDIAQEQKEQMGYKDRRKNFDKEIEKQWVEIEKQKMTEYDDRLR